VNDAETKAMRSCFYAASTSPDPSTQNAAMVLLSGNTRDRVKFIGPRRNEFPNGVLNVPSRWERPTKYMFVEHAERAVIYQAARDGVTLRGATMVAVWAACSDCARAIIAAGIVRLVRHSGHGKSETWDESIRIGDRMMLEAGIVLYDDATEYGDLPLVLRSRKTFKP
jgi:dCMP deaminase